MVYNGTYWCTACSWGMGEDDGPDRIIAAYLLQRRDEALERDDDDTAAEMERHLVRYDGVALN